ncbi:MAG: tRNA(5-methylaminomethyl-2-thiouridylate) methyltransferase [Desulfovibrionaceae bacterium]
MEQFDVVVLFSGGLDSLLSTYVLKGQGLRVRCLHFVSPFFGSPRKTHFWKEVYDLDVECIDISEQYITMLQSPLHGYGKTLNPCIDCKVTMIKHAKMLMEECGAFAIATGEIVGQRPMSQRREVLGIIKRDAEVEEFLVRPLTAKLLPPTKAEIDGKIDREQLLDLSGRSRKRQMELAQQYNITIIPSPAGGCRLTYENNASAYFPLLKYNPSPCAVDFAIANAGRQYWSGKNWLTIGRNAEENVVLSSYASHGDYLFYLDSAPGPFAIGKSYEDIPEWSEKFIRESALFILSFAKKVLRENDSISVVVEHNTTKKIYTFSVAECIFSQPFSWSKLLWEDMKKEAHTAEAME